MTARGIIYNNPEAQHRHFHSEGKEAQNKGNIDARSLSREKGEISYDVPKRPTLMVRNELGGNSLPAGAATPRSDPTHDLYPK